MEAHKSSNCKDCGRPTIRKLLLTSYYDHCEKCELAKSMGAKSYRHVDKEKFNSAEEFKRIVTTSSAPVTRHLSNGQPIAFDPYAVVTLPPGLAINPKRIASANQALGAPYGQPQVKNFYPKDDPFDCPACFNKLSCACIDVCIDHANGATDYIHMPPGSAQVIPLGVGATLSFKDARFNFTVGVKGTYQVANLASKVDIQRLSP